MTKFELDFTNFYNEFKKLFEELSYITGRRSDPVPYITPQEYSNLQDIFAKYKDFYNRTIEQTVFSTPESRKTFELILQSLSALHTRFKLLQQISDPLSVSGKDLDSLLLSFGFPSLDIPVYVKQQVLLNLVHNYKIKGTLTSVQNVLDIIVPGTVHVHEWEFIKDSGNVFFRRQFNIDIPGSTSSDYIYVPAGPVIQKDRHWWTTLSDLQNWPISRAMSPYFSLDLGIDPIKNLLDVIILRTYAYRDYQVLITNPALYEDTKTLQTETLPQKINYLELYLLIRYIFLKIYNIENVINDDPNHRNYMYTPPSDDYDTIVDYLQQQFETRYDNSFLDNKILEQHCDHIESEVSSLPLCKLPQQAEAQTIELSNLTRVGCVCCRNTLFIVGGQYANGTFNTNLIVSTTYSSNVSTFPIGLKILDPIVTCGSCNTICVTGGYDEFGNKNYKTWIIDLNTFSVTEVQNLPERLWMENPVLVSAQNGFVYAISTSEDDNCTGGIYLFNSCSGYKKLLAFINPDDYDLSYCKAVCDSKNRLWIVTKSKLSGGIRILFLDPHPKNEIFCDITCPLIMSIPIYERYKFAQHLLNGEIFLVTNTNILSIFYIDDAGIVNMLNFDVTYEIGPTVTKIRPKKLSGMLIPSRICKMCPMYYQSEQIHQDFCQHDFDNYGYAIVETQQYYDYYFFNVIDRATGDKIYFWPLIKQISTLCCNSDYNQIAVILPRLYIHYDDACVYDTLDFSEDCYFFFICFNAANNTIGTTSVTEASFEDPFKLSSDEVENNHFCYCLYDTICDYDIQNDSIRVVCLSSYPNIPYSLVGTPEYNIAMQVYYEFDLPQYIDLVFKKISFLQFNIEMCEVANYNWSSVFQNSNVFIAKYEDSGSTYIHILEIFPKIINLFFADCEITYDENIEGARYTRSELLSDREIRIISNTEQLPIFSDFSSLRSFLISITPDNIDTIDSSLNLSYTLYELLSIASTLYPGANLTTLIPSHITKNVSVVVDMFKPIHSRYTGVNFLFPICDPVGDWITLASSIAFGHVKSLVSALNLDDCFKRYITQSLPDRSENIVDIDDNFSYGIGKVFTDTINTSDYIQLGVQKGLIEHISISDSTNMSTIVNLIYDNGTNEQYDNHWWGPIPIPLP